MLISFPFGIVVLISLRFWRRTGTRRTWQGQGQISVVLTKQIAELSFDPSYVLVPPYGFFPSVCCTPENRAACCGKETLTPFHAHPYLIPTSSSTGITGSVKKMLIGFDGQSNRCSIYEENKILRHPPPHVDDHVNKRSAQAFTWDKNIHSLGNTRQKS